jgi:hypothetical protein
MIRAADHLELLLSEFAVYYNEYRGHMTLRGAVPQAVHRGERWQRPDRSAKALAGTVERRFFPDTRTTAYRLAAWPQAGSTGG